MVEPETFTFLADLAQNNRKVWMDENRVAFDDARRNFTGIAITLHDYAERFDPFLVGTKIKPKQSYTKLFQEPRDRIGRALYRADVDVFANAGHPTEDFGYYLHIEPGNCYAGAAMFQPTKEALAGLRERLVDDPDGLVEVLDDADFKATFTEGLITRKPLSAAPDGFPKRGPTAPYFKMGGLGCRKALPDEMLLEHDAIYTLIDIFRAASPLVRYFE